MQSVQRRFGKFLPRTADESQVAVLLKDFDDADKMLSKVDLIPTFKAQLLITFTSDHRCVESLARFLERHTRNPAAPYSWISDDIFANNWG